MDARLDPAGYVGERSPALLHGHGGQRLDPELREAGLGPGEGPAGLLADILEQPGLGVQFTGSTQGSSKKPDPASSSRMILAESEHGPEGEMRMLCLRRVDPLTRSPQET